MTSEVAMKTRLTIQEKLRDLRAEKGFTLEQLSAETGIAPSTLGKYESDEYKDISHSYLLVLAKYYHVSADWLLGLSETREPVNFDIATLQLDDETLALLKSGRINNRLLCEMIRHPNFPAMMADAEIYVDGIAAMQIKNMNDWVGLVRQQIINKYDPTRDDLYLRVLDTARIDEEEYLFHTIHKDLDKVLRSIREAHQQAAESAPVAYSALDEKRIYRFVQSLKYKSNPVEEFWRIFCDELQIDYDKLSEDEHATMKQVFKKSKRVRQIASHKHKARK